MAHVELEIDGGAALECRSLTGTERLGEDCRFELLAFAHAPVPFSDVLGKGCVLRLAGAFGTRSVQGTIVRVSLVATAQAALHRRYKLVVRSSTFGLALRRQTKVFQHLTVPQIVEAVLLAGGVAAAQIDVAAASGTPTHDYIVQYDETDAAFVRRLCEEEGLYFRFESRDGVETFVLEGDSTSAPAAASPKVVLCDENALDATSPSAFACEEDRTFVTGSLMVRGYDVDHPAAKLEGKAMLGTDGEKAYERFVAPARLTTPDSEEARAGRLLEATRATARLYRFRSTAHDLAPGTSFEMTLSLDYTGLVAPEGEHLVVAIRHAWAFDTQHYDLEVEAIPLDVPFRLPLVTPRPKAAGIHSAVVTGAGDEIHSDALGRVFLRFPWDREGPTDFKSSLPVRVAQPNTPGSMMTPRVGWEVYTVFEDGDPDRPLVIGRAYNGKQRPPYALPTNKTMTAIETSSSPGGGTNNSVKFDDAAGRQNIAFEAGYDLNATIANNLQRNVGNNEQLLVKGSQSWDIGACQEIDVTNEITVHVGMQLAAVGGMQLVDVGGGEKVLVNVEVVAVGGALLEKVGSIATGLKNWALAAAMSAPGWVGGAMGGNWATAGALLSKYGGAAAKLGKATWDLCNALAAAERSGKSTANAWAGFGGSVLGTAAEVVGLPGAEGVTQFIEQAGDLVAEHQDEATEAAHAAGGEEHGGGAAAAEGTGAAASPGGAGKRDTLVRGAMVEMIGGAYVVTTPGSTSWATGGYSLLTIGGSHVTRALKYEYKVGGSMSTTAGALYITAKVKDIVRDVKGPATTSVGGPLKYDAGLNVILDSHAKTTLDVGGAIDMSGSIAVFKVGGSTVSLGSGGLCIESSEVIHNGKSLQKAEATHK